MDTSNYKVRFSDFSQRHYIKGFAKKYKSNWARTQADIVAICQRIDNLLSLNRQQADLIKAVGDNKLIKLDFAVEGTQKSPKASGNRAILWVDERAHLVTVLMVYAKSDIKGRRETDWWQQAIRANCPGVGELFWPPASN